MFSPEGTSAGYDPCKERDFGELLVGDFFEAHVSQGPLYAGIEAEAGFSPRRDNVRNGFSDTYENVSPDAGIKNWGFKAGVTVGGEVTVHF